MSLCLGGKRMLLSSGYREGTSLWGFNGLFQRKRERQGEKGRVTFLSLLFAQTPSAETIPHARVSYFEVACPEPHQEQVDVGKATQSLDPNLTQHDFCCLLLTKARCKDSPKIKEWTNRLQLLMGEATKWLHKGCGYRHEWKIGSTHVIRLLNRPLLF